MHYLSSTKYASPSTAPTTTSESTYSQYNYYNQNNHQICIVRLHTMLADKEKPSPTQLVVSAEYVNLT